MANRTHRPHRTGLTHEQYLLGYIDRSADSDNCWPWLGHVESQGYGIDAWQGHGRSVKRTAKAHRSVYQMLVGAIPAGMELDHTCHNHSGCDLGNDCLHRRCCNPAHLQPVIRKVNLLRGNGRMARQARQTECIHGHPLVIEGVDYYFKPKYNRRVCKPCLMEAQRRRRARKRMAFHA